MPRGSEARPGRVSCRVAGGPRRSVRLPRAPPEGGVCRCSSMVERQLPKLDTRVRFPSPAPTTKPQVRDPLPACDFPVVGPKIPPRARYMPNQERGSCPSCPFAPPDRALCEASMRLSRASATSRAAAHRLGRIRPRGQACSGCLIARIAATKRLHAGSVSGQTRSRCPAGRSQSRLPNPIPGCGSHLDCASPDTVTRRGSRGDCPARSSTAHLAVLTGSRVQEAPWRA